MSLIGEVERIHLLKANERIEEEISELFSNAGRSELYEVAGHLVSKPFQYEFAVLRLLLLLFEDSLAYAELLRDLLEAGMALTGKDESHDELRLKFVSHPDIVSSLVKKLIGKRREMGRVAGAILSLITETETGKGVMRDYLSSSDDEKQAAGLIAFTNLIRRGNHQRLEDLLILLTQEARSISSGNTPFLLWCLDEACNVESAFVPLLEQILRERGSLAASAYLSGINLNQERPISCLKIAVEILEKCDHYDTEIVHGLSEIYPRDPDFVVHRLRRLISKANVQPHSWDMLTYQIKKHGKTPVITMLEELIDEPNSYASFFGDHHLEIFFQSLSEWVSWCEKWESDDKKERVVTNSLMRILTKLKTYKQSDDRDRAIDLVRRLARRKGFDYESETRHISYGKAKEEGWEHKEAAMKALHVLDLIAHPKAVIDRKVLKTNLARAPYVCRALGKRWLLSSAESGNPHPLAFIFGEKLPTKKELDGLRTQFETEESRDRRWQLATRHNALLLASRSQVYWEGVFRTLSEHGLSLRKTKLRDVSNARAILSEAEVLSRLAPSFQIEIEPSVEQVGETKLDALIRDGEEVALIEIATIGSGLEESLSRGAVVGLGGRTKNVILGKFRTQLKQGQIGVKEPIVLLLNLSGSFQDDLDAENAIYGRLQFSYKIRTDTHDVVEEGASRADDSFFGIEGADIVSCVGVYRRDLHNPKDPLKGRLYRPPIRPRNRLSEGFRCRIRNAIFGESETSPWHTLMKVNGIDEALARHLYDFGVEDLGVLAGCPVGEFEVEDFSTDDLGSLQEEAMRIVSAIQTDSVRFLRPLDQQTYEVLLANGIYLIGDVLKNESPPEGISDEVWQNMRSDARRIHSEALQADQQP